MCPHVVVSSIIHSTILADHLLLLNGHLLSEHTLVVLGHLLVVEHELISVHHGLLKRLLHSSRIDLTFSHLHLLLSETLCR